MSHYRTCLPPGFLLKFYSEVTYHYMMSSSWHVSSVTSADVDEVSHKMGRKDTSLTGARQRSFPKWVSIFPFFCVVMDDRSSIEGKQIFDVPKRGTSVGNPVPHKWFFYFWHEQSMSFYLYFFGWNWTKIRYEISAGGQLCKRVGRLNTQMTWNYTSNCTDIWSALNIALLR